MGIWPRPGGAIGIWFGRLPGMVEPLGGLEPSCCRFIGVTKPRPEGLGGAGAGTGEPLRWIDGSDGTLGFEPVDRLGWLERDRTLPLRLGSGSGPRPKSRIAP